MPSEQNSESPLVSVVIPTYNRADVLPRAIRSVIRQTFTDFELIIIDDGSQDRTREVVKEFTDPRIRYIRQENQGANAARNHGIRKAKGRYISFLDSDDEFHENNLQRVIETLENHGSNCIGAYTSYRRLRDGEVTHISSADKRKVTFDDIRKENTIGGFSAITFRASVFQKVGYLDEQLQSAQDYDIYLRSLQEGGYIIGIAEVLADQHLDEHRISDDIKKKKKGLGRIIEKHEETLAPSRIADQHYMIGFLHAENKDLGLARREFWKAIRTYPYNPFYYYHLLFSFAGLWAFKKSLDFKKSIKVYLKGS